MDDIRTYPARIVERATPADIAGLELPDGIEPFVFPAEISSNRLDAYFSHMGDSSLRNYANEAADGVSFLDSHNHRQLALGYTFTGLYEIQGEVGRVVSDIYTLPGIAFGGGRSYASTDDFIKAVKARIVRDVSIGFYGGQEICDICGRDVWGWLSGDDYCPHLPGVEYAIGEQGGKTILATSTVNDAHLSEVSAVYDGATPGAMIEKARQMRDAGKLTSAGVHQLEVRYRIKLPGQQVWTGIGEKTMADKPEQNELAQIRAILAEVEAPGDPVEGLRWLVDQVAELNVQIDSLERQDERIASLEAEVSRLQPLADDGTAYRADLVEQALAEGVRAMGSQFPEETYRGLLASSSLEHIKRIRDSFAEQARALFNGGRQSVDKIQEPPQRSEPETPDLAYAG